VNILRLPRRPALWALVAIAIAVAGSTVAPPAGAAVTVGIGQQTPEMFSNRFWRVLHAPNVRYIAPWDALSDPHQRAVLDAWMAAAHAARARVMIGFQHSLRSARLARVLPTPAQFARAFRGFRRRYPQVRDWVPWNESNDPLALTGSRPDRAAAYFNIATGECPGCNIVAADVLDIDNMESWVLRFLRYTRAPPRIWGIHNYHDANSFTSAGTRRMLRLVRGQIWFTETGGLVARSERLRGRVSTWRYGVQHAASATRYVLDLARISPRIRRIYLYHWRAPARFTTWDSALMDARQRPRVAYRVLRAWLEHARRTRLAD
jgi:hypothetical protein